MQRLFAIGFAVAGLCAPLAYADTPNASLPAQSGQNAQFTRLQSEVLALQGQLAGLQNQVQPQSHAPADVTALVTTGG